MRLFATIFGIILLFPGLCSVGYTPAIFDSEAYLYGLVLLFWIPGAILGVIALCVFAMLWTSRKTGPKETNSDAASTPEMNAAIKISLIAGAILLTSPVMILFTGPISLSQFLLIVPIAGFILSAAGLVMLAKYLRQ